MRSIILVGTILEDEKNVCDTHQVLHVLLRNERHSTSIPRNYQFPTRMGHTLGRQASQC